jgi:hypothetical protein
MVAIQYWSGARVAALGIAVFFVLPFASSFAHASSKGGHYNFMMMMFFMAILISVDTGMGLVVGILSGLPLWAAVAAGIGGGLVLGTFLALFAQGRWVNSESVFYFYFAFPVILGVCIGIKTTATDGLLLGFLLAIIYAYCLGLTFGGFWVDYWFWPITWLLARGAVPFRLNRFFCRSVNVGIMRRYGSAYQFNHAYLRRYLLQGEQSQALMSD